VRVALLWIAAALISGFTLRRYIGPLDEGILMQAAARMGEGEWPWRDFGWAYGPGQPLFVLAAEQLFGPSLLWWRLLRVAADATAAVLVYALVRDARPRWALPAWAAAAVTAAQPVSANPTSPALAFALGSVLLATRGRAGWAGAAAAAAAFWRPDVGACAALAAAAALLVGGRARFWVAPLVAAGGVALLYAPFVIAAGPARVWDALVLQAGRDGEWWRLPFPSGYEGSDPKDFLAWLAPYAALITLALALLRLRVTAGLVVLGAGAAAYYLSRADLEHAQALLIVAAALAALIRPKAMGVAMLAILLVVGITNRGVALLRPPDLAPLQHARIPPGDAQALRQTIARVQQLVPPGEPIYVAPRRSDLVTFSNPLLHYLTERPNVLHRDVLLQAKPDEQQNIVDALEAQRPRAIIRWTAPESARPEPNRRGRPSGSTILDDYLNSAYRPDARYGDYLILVPR
jgi:hypothetical protein